MNQELKRLYELILKWDYRVLHTKVREEEVEIKLCHPFYSRKGEFGKTYIFLTGKREWF